MTGTTATLDESDFQADKSWIDDVWETECGLSKVAYAGQEGKVRVKRVPEVSEDDMLDLGYWRRARDGTRARHTGAGRQGEEMYSRTVGALFDGDCAAYILCFYIYMSLTLG